MRRILRMIRFEHTVFSLPFALSGAWLAAGGAPPPGRLAGILVAAVAARTAAMTFNRIADRRLDAENPRTRDRELVTGAVSLKAAGAFTVASSAVFVGVSFLLAPVCGWLSLPVLALLLGYSFFKRFTLLCHFGLGLALACAPAGAWLAVQGAFLPGWEVPLFLGLGVVAWVAGFDLLYALQDADYDRRQGLFSIPARFGSRPARLLAALLHLLALGFFLDTGLRAGLGAAYFTGVAAVALLFVGEHAVLRGGRLDRVPLAFFRINAWVGPVYFAGLFLDLPLATLSS